MVVLDALFSDISLRTSLKMAHFAQVSGEINEVVYVIVIPNEQEHRASEFITGDLGLIGNWIQTSYNTRGGIHTSGGTPLRKNFAGIGYTYDSVRDAFIPPKPEGEGWVLDEFSCLWVKQ